MFAWLMAVALMCSVVASLAYVVGSRYGMGRSLVVVGLSWVVLAMAAFGVGVVVGVNAEPPGSRFCIVSGESEADRIDEVEPFRATAGGIVPTDSGCHPSETLVCGEYLPDSQRDPATGRRVFESKYCAY